MSSDDAKKEFSVRQNWLGQLILQTRDFSVVPHSGDWRDARPRDLPELFSKLLPKVKP